jgi:hypothetical protein
MALLRTRTLTMVWLATMGVAQAQTTAAPDTPTPTTPSPITPPGGIARGVIRPTRPVDSNMVKHPPTNDQHKMPVIRPPGTAR